jgi:DNA-binding FadR family transcriptional regulator
VKPFPTESLNARVHLPRLADVVADRIRDAILSGELKDGERLPPLETLLQQFGVSAPSMREALRILEAEGLVAVQRGGIGGAIIRVPTAKTAAYNLALVLRSRGTRMSDVARAIATLQPSCAMLCAQRSDRKTKVLRELRHLNKAAKDLVESDELLFNDAMLEFHRSVVRLAGNDTMTLVTRALEHIWLADVQTWVISKAAHGEYPGVDERRRGVKFHEEITDLIAAGDGEQAAKAMSDHITGSVYPSLVRTDGPVDPRTVRFSPSTD